MFRMYADAGHSAPGEALDMTTAIEHVEGSPARLEAATVADAMSVGVISCPPETPLRNVAALMSNYRVHGVFVFDYGGDNDERTARDSAVTPLVTVRGDERLDRAALLMAETGVSHLAVIDAVTQRPAGVLSTFDIVRVLAPPLGRLRPRTQ